MKNLMDLSISELENYFISIDEKENSAEILSDDYSGVVFSIALNAE